PPQPQLDAGVVEFAEDLGRRAVNALERGRLYREARRAVSLRDEFLGIASHELRTPLTPLTLGIHTLRRLVTDPAPEELARARETVEMCERQLRRLSALVNELLDVTRLSAGAFELVPAEMDLAELVREVVAGATEHARRFRSILELSAPDHVHGVWDRSRLEAVVQNLLTNALKYGGGKPVRIRLECDGAVARLSVADEGIGIRADDLPRIFQKFERAVPTRHYGGLGLGLYIADQIVRGHGGTITVDSVPGQGSTFTVTLPLHPPADGERPPPGTA
ncbi:MAG: sensor histidine kinase, partial [Myxococcales bacterium]